MADVTYESLQSQIGQQKTQIISQREQIKQERIAGEKGIKILKRVSPRVKPSVYFEEREPQIKKIKSRFGELEKHKVSLSEAEQKLSEQEKLLQERKAEGWKIREKDGQYEFYKVTQVPSTGIGVPRGDFSVRITWRDYRTKPEGEIKTVRGLASNLESMQQQIADRGGQVIEVESLGGGREFRTPEMRTTVGASFLLYEAPAIVKKPIKTAKEIEVYTGIYEKIPERIVTKRFLPTPVKFAEVRGVPSDVFKEWKEGRVITTTRDMTQAEITELLSKMTKEEKLVWYKEHGRFGEEEKTWSEIQREQPFWELTVKNGDPFIETPKTSERLLLKWHRAKYEDVDPVTGFIGKYTSALVHGTFDPEFWIRLARGGPESARVVVARGERRVDPLIEEGKWGEYAWSVVTSPGYTNIVLPFAAGAGIGKVFQIGAKLAPAYGKGAEIIARGTPWVVGGGISAYVGADIGLTAARTREEELGGWGSTETLSKIFGYGMQFTSAGIGTHWARGVHLSEKQLLRIDQARIDFNKSMSKIPGYEPAYEQISIFKTTGKYGVLQDGVRYPSALYSGVRARMSAIKQPMDAFVARSAWLQQQRIISKYAFEPPISMEQRYRDFAIRSPYTMTGAIRIQPRVGYAVPIESIARIAPRDGYLIKPSVEVMPKIFETTELIFTKKVPVKGGYLLEYMQETDIHYKPFTRGLPYEYEKMKGFGQIFKPDIPGKYTIGGRKVFIGATEAYDLFVGRKILLRTFGGRAERIGITRGVYAESKLQIPKHLQIKSPVERLPIVKRGVPYYDTRGLPDFEKTPLTKTIQNIDQEFYRFFSATKQTGLPGRTSFTVGLGRTQELFTLHSPSKAFKLPVSRYVTVGEVTPIKDVTGIPGQKIPVRGTGQVYDITEWYGTDYLKTPVTSYQQNIFTQLKTLRAANIVSSYAVSDVGTGKTIYPYAQPKTITYDSPHGGQVIYTGVKTYAATSPFITTIVGVSPVVVKDVKPIFKQMDRTMPMMVYDARLEYATVTIQLEKELTKLMPKQITKPMTRIEEKMITRQLERQITKPMTRQIERQITKPMTRQIEKQITKPMTKQITRLLEKQITKQITKEIMKPVITYMPPIYDSRYGLVKTPVKEIIEPPPPMPPPVFIFPDTPYKMFGHTMGQGYNVKIKERHIVKGKKIKEPRFIRVNKHPLGREDAQSLMGMVLDNSAAASGKIVPVNAMAQEPLIKLKPFENIEHKFYMKDDIIIEKTKYRIDTKGEVAGIPARAWYAERTEKAAKKREAVVRRPRAKAVREVDMFDVGMDDMLINMNKIFKGVFDFGF